MALGVPNFSGGGGPTSGPAPTREQYTQRYTPSPAPAPFSISTATQGLSPVSTQRPTGNIANSSLVGSLVQSASYVNQMMNSPHMAWSNYLQNAIAGTNANYDRLINSVGSGIAGMGASGAAGYNRAVSAANQNRDLALQQIANDLMYGNQLRDQDRFRTVELGGQRNDNQWWYAQQAWSNLQRALDDRTGTTRDRWGELQRHVGQQRGFGKEALGLSIADTDLWARSQTRMAVSDATSRGAMTSAGHADTVAEIAEKRGINNQQADLEYRRFMENLQNELNNGRISFNEAMNAIGDARRTGKLDFQMSEKDYKLTAKELASLDKTFGILGTQAHSDADLARQRAMAAAQQAIGGARSGMEAQQSAAAAQQSAAAQQAAQQRYALQQQHQQALNPLLQQAAMFAGMYAPPTSPPTSPQVAHSGFHSGSSGGGSVQRLMN